MRGLKQEVRVRLDFDVAGVDPVEEEVEGVTTHNIRSRIKGAIDNLLIQYSVSDGAEIKVVVGPAEEDELARPDPE